MTLLGEAGGSGAGSGGGGDALKNRFECKINTAVRDAGGAGGAGATSQSVRNDIRRSEKTGEKVSKHTGRDDRATVEQVRTNESVCRCWCR